MMCRPVDNGKGIIGRLARLNRNIRQSGAWEFVRSALGLDSLMKYPHASVYYGCTSYFTEVSYFRRGWNVVLVRVGDVDSEIITDGILSGICCK